MKSISYKTPQEALKACFGYDSFRPGQEKIIDSILSGRDVLAVMPTGAGKSICYQVPALMLPGVTIVVSPLISLMQDQVKALNEAGIPSAFINSSLEEKVFFDVVRQAEKGRYKMIYVAPERLLTENFLSLTRKLEISMVTVDEAHCISQWGQDFRPSYRKITEFIAALEKRPVIGAFTATATEMVREDILCSLGLENPFTLVTGFDRQNLFFQVERPDNKDRYLLTYLAKHEGESGIIYCATRKAVDAIYDLLKSRGHAVSRYHAGMSSEERKKMQDDFIYDYTDLVVATNAFGMGIDKSNVRFVIHYNMPQSMENYYQEAGRAGRDGLRSGCVLLFSPQDIVINRFLLDHKEMTDLDPEDRIAVAERDTERLQAMEGYCYTTDCLRNYILNYFGEKTQKPCGNCGNCLKTFETVDMTQEAKKIINCVYEARGRYGRTIILDAVAGAKTARLEEIGAKKFKSYGTLASSGKKLLRRLMEQLIAEGYLTVGDYQVIRLGEIGRLKDPSAKVLVKITEEDKKAGKTEKAGRAGKANQTVKSGGLTSSGYKLFDRLREKRLEIAREEKMPPYIVFNDRTLMDMAEKMPESPEELLRVSGVGQYKLEKYGEQFLAEIRAWKAAQPPSRWESVTGDGSD